jgi:hypothetical protein
VPLGSLKRAQFGFRLYVEAEDPHILAITEVNEQDPDAVFETDPN